MSFEVVHNTIFTMCCRFVSNLHWNVTKEDIKELFETCGTLVRHEVHYDKADRSAGTAEVVFQSRGDAERAQRRYNTVQLDGMAMAIDLIEKADSTSAFGGGRALKSGIRITGGAAPSGPSRMFAQAATQAADERGPRGRGSIRSRVVSDRMQE
jgi:THO complex subunit 4